MLYFRYVAPEDEKIGVVGVIHKKISAVAKGRRPERTLKGIGKETLQSLRCVHGPPELDRFALAIGVIDPCLSFHVFQEAVRYLRGAAAGREKVVHQTDSEAMSASSPPERVTACLASVLRQSLQ